MQRFRRFVFWCHLAVALFVGVVVLVMSITGVLLTYQRQMQWWADTRGLAAAPPAPGAERLAAGAVLAGVDAAVEGDATGVTWYAAPDAPVAVAFGRGRVVYANAYTGEVLGEGSAATRRFFRVVTDWHRWLARTGERRDVGRAITGASNLGFLFLVLSGFYLWWPRNRTRRAVRNVTVFRGGLKGKARDFNWHNVIGFWSAVPLAIVVASAVVISYPWASDLVYRLAGDTPPSAAGAGAVRAGEGGAARVAAGGRDRTADAAAPDADFAGPSGAATRDFADLSEIEAVAERQVDGWRSITMQPPGAGAATVAFTIDAGSGGQPHRRARVVLDRATGEVVQWEPFSSGTPGRRLRSILRFAHTGEVAGLVGQTIAGLVSLGAVVLVWTGMALTLRRFVAWRRRRRDRPREAPRRSSVEREVATPV